jgi:hypothetical protein
MNPETPSVRAASESRGSAVFWMLISAGLFGYFGFMLSYPNTLRTGDPNWISIVLMWTIRATAIGFAVSALLLFLHRFIAHLFFSSIGLLSAIMFGIVIIWHFTTDAHAPIPIILLIIFALWNGYSSWRELSGMLAGRRFATPMIDR